MGQYHYLVNLKKSEFVHPHRLGDGLKVWEMAGHSLGGIATALVYLVACPTPRGGGDLEEGPFMGRWHGDPVALVGDYAEPGDGLCLSKEGIEGLWSEGHPGWTDITTPLREALAAEFELKYSGEGWMDRGPHSGKPERAPIMPDAIVAEAITGEDFTMSKIKLRKNP